jgi:Vitelline membrane outer layer protein I (VOMI)
MRMSRSRISLVALVCVLLAGSLAYAGLKGKLYVKPTEALLTERSGQPCRSDNDRFCERNYQCPTGEVAHALLYNIKEEAGKKRLAGLSLVCSDPNLFTDPSFVGAGGDAFSGEVINDYCPVGYLVAGAEFYTSDRQNLTGARRICRRYEPADERKGPNLYGEGFDSMINDCNDRHWVTGIKVSFERATGEDGKIDTSIVNARFYCNEIRHYLIEPSDKEMEEAEKELRH